MLARHLIFNIFHQSVMDLCFHVNTPISCTFFCQLQRFTHCLIEFWPGRIKGSFTVTHCLIIGCCRWSLRLRIILHIFLFESNVSFKICLMYWIPPWDMVPLVDDRLDFLHLFSPHCSDDLCAYHLFSFRFLRLINVPASKFNNSRFSINHTVSGFIMSNGRYFIHCRIFSIKLSISFLPCDAFESWLMALLIKD